MKICFYAPFKPMCHPNPSGDQVIARGLAAYLKDRGVRLEVASLLRCRWIYHKPWLWPRVLMERRRAYRMAGRVQPDIWLTYHSYYKAPDILGPAVCRKTDIAYVIFQGIYSTRRRRDLRTGLGFLLNRRALLSARHVFSNRKEDEKNLLRLLPRNRVSLIAPGIFPERFRFDPEARTVLRGRWGVGQTPVVLSAAMFRPDVKTEGLAWTIRACGKIYRKGIDFRLVIAGDGRERDYLEALGEKHIPGGVRFLGKIPRHEMYRIYSAADLFVFPGIRESLGMVYLEAQSCGIPVVAFSNGGIPEVAQNGKTGFLTGFKQEASFQEAIERLLLDERLRKDMGKTAAEYVRSHHDLNRNYGEVLRTLMDIARRKKR